MLIITEQKKRANVKLAIVLPTVIAALLGILVVVCYICRSRRKLKGETEDNNVNDKENDDIELATWRLWTEGNPSDVVNDFLVESGDLSELLRCIHISLLCVQQHPEERPDMPSVVLMLGSRSELPLLKQPSFLFYNKPFEAYSSPANDGLYSRNEISLSTLEAR
ncbi:hypothetical protein V6N12_054537 [Hibiscus sabdariffa]|uniref:S-locus receptor kinase C-terminal domain-containing protein n=1 Tax=Hibiscus sabdariffa TaxID=183260 RepID=A0ABR2D0R4_9ROSI